MRRALYAASLRGVAIAGQVALLRMRLGWKAPILGACTVLDFALLISAKVVVTRIDALSGHRLGLWQTATCLTIMFTALCSYCLGFDVTPALAASKEMLAAVKDMLLTFGTWLCMGLFLGQWPVS